MPSNQLRSECAYVAMKAFADCTGQTEIGELENDPNTVILDLLCNLMHYAHIHGLPFQDAYRQAQEHFTYETTVTQEDTDG